MKRLSILLFIPVLCFISCVTTMVAPRQSKLPKETKDEIQALAKNPGWETVSVKIPSENGNLIRIRIGKPEGKGPFPMLIGCAWGDTAYAFNNLSIFPALLEMGIAGIDFAPQGRMGSEGEDNYNGKIHQHDLIAVIEFAENLKFTNTDEIGLLTLSYGVVMATGALSEKPELPVMFLIDWEGPACPGKDILDAAERSAEWLNSSGFARLTGRMEVGDPDTFVISGAPLSDAEYWNERDAERFARTLPCPYLRIQAEEDHVQGNEKYHMMKIVNAVTQHAGQWSRVNDNPPNIIYTLENLNKYNFHEKTDPGKVITPYIKEMFFEKPWQGPDK